MMRSHPTNGHGFDFQKAETSLSPSLRAKRSNPCGRKEKMDCFVASLLAMTAKYESAFPRRDAPELCMNPSPNKGRGECRALAAPAASCVK
jgi:hypothetical protein